MKRKSIVSVLLVMMLFLTAAVLPARPAEAASKKNVYVVTGIWFQTEQGDSVNIRTYSYKSNGMLKSGTRANGTSKIKFTYDDKGRLKTYQTLLNQWQKRSYTYNKKGKISKIDTTYVFDPDGKFAYDGFHSVYKFNKKNQVVSEKASGEVWDEELERSVDVVYDIRYTYNKKGLLATKTNKTTGEKIKLSYDKKGMTTTMTYSKPDGYVETYKSKNTYDKKGLLTKCVETFTTSEEEKTVTTYVYKYKKLKVKKSMVSKVKDQQNAIFNQKLNFTIPDNDYFYGM